MGIFRSNRRAMLIVVLLLSCVLALLSCTASKVTPASPTPTPGAQSTRATDVPSRPVISGVVLSGTTPVAGARVELHAGADADAPTGETIAQTLSDADGRYAVEVPSDGGEFGLVAVWPDGSASSAPFTPVRVAPGTKSVEADVYLTREQDVTGPTTGEEGSATPALQYVFQVPADPIGVTPILDSQQQAEAIIPVSGGVLSATGTDGSVFLLEVSADALTVDTLIRMTPLSSLEGMPFGSDPLAVQLEPEGLQLYRVITLTITPAQELPIDQQIFFGYRGEGENLILANPVVDSPEIKMQLLHFSGYGVTKGFLADTASVRARIGGDAESRLQSALAEQLTRTRQEQLLGQETSEPIDWESAFQQYEDQVVKPRIAAAGESCAAGRLAIQTALGHERQKQLLGMGSDTGNPLIANGLMETVAEVCMKEEYELCRDEHIIHRIIPAWLGLERQFQLLGLAADGGAQMPVLEDAKNYVRKCLTFELRFESQMSFDDADGGYDSSVVSKVKIQFNSAKLDMSGSAPLVNTAFEFRVPDCSVTSNRGGGTFEAMSLAYISDTKSPTDELGYVRDFTLVYYPGNTAESFKVKCEDSPSYTSPSTPLWTGGFLITHEGEMSQADGGFIAENWEIFGDEYYAKIEWIREDAASSVTEAGTLKLYHKPE
jgi:hypothetical protein